MRGRQGRRERLRAIGAKLIAVSDDDIKGPHKIRQQSTNAHSDFLSLSAVPDSTFAKINRFHGGKRNDQLPFSDSSRNAKVSFASAVAKKDSAEDLKKLSQTGGAQCGVLIKDTVSAAQAEYRAHFKHTPGPGGADDLQAREMEALFARQLLREQGAQRKRQAERAAEAAATSFMAGADGKSRRKRNHAESTVSTEAKQNMIASALDRVLMKGVIGDGEKDPSRRFNFNPEAVLRGEAGWRIVARLAKVRDLEPVVDELLWTQVEEHIREIAKEARDEEDAKLYREVESMLRSAYPLVAYLSQDELRAKIREAEEAGRLEDGTGIAVAKTAQGMLGRKLCLVRTVHELIVEDFNRVHGIRTRTQAAQELATVTLEKQKKRNREQGQNREVEDSSREEFLEENRPSSSFYTHAAKAVVEGEVWEDQPAHQPFVRGWGKPVDGANSAHDDEDDIGNECEGTSDYLRSREVQESTSFDQYPNDAKKQGEITPETARYLAPFDDNDVGDDDNASIALVIPVQRSPLRQEDSSSTAFTAFRHQEQEQNSNLDHGDEIHYTGINADLEKSGNDCFRRPSDTPEMQTLMNDLLATCEQLTLSRLRDELRALGMDTGTPGLRGAPRHHMLRTRLLTGLRLDADAADAADLEERTNFLGGAGKVNAAKRERGAAKLRSWLNRHSSKHPITED